MATDLENMQTIRSNILAALADLTANPKPDYMVDGQRVLWSSMRESLNRDLESIEKRIATESPQECFSYGYSPCD